VVTNDSQNSVIDKASKIIDVLNLHLSETVRCRHSLDEILKDIEENYDDTSGDSDTIHSAKQT